ncbi:hypothetical protein Ngar_c33650 [Candidatus Nitrososphaera gargensis Ga9.2]|uniref:Uncharacterized protein n=1 Tax=Nitrososphaera gargensis (strain Ga9.2) TaxID=1237085 RepID=K0IJP4_NITGG|nr:hypothetical protein [Candidatus Nitrososphaera gargensis]AFU60280.1 hypothetical protein Ngar_c33650 [Candidatus Nitrososphaera gargensis Ga9.2]
MSWVVYMIMIIDLGVAAAVAFPLLFIQSINTITTTFPADDPCTNFSCAEK